MLINHAGISGGKDSTALLLWMVHESGYPTETIRATFCDTGNELPETYSYIEYLNSRVHPIITLKPPLDFYELAEKKGRFPSPKVRFCTTELKMLPSRTYAYGLLDEGHEVLLHTGVRAEESRDRAKLPERDWDAWYGLPVYRPLLSWCLEDVWAIHERYGVERNPLYAMGFKRVSCGPCMMSRKAEIRLIARTHPQAIDRIREAENATGSRTRGFSSFFHSQTVTRGHHSRTHTNPETGETFPVCSIDDVVRWSKTSRGGTQFELDFEDEPHSCASESGACE